VVPKINMGPPYQAAIRRLAVILRQQELSTVTALVSKNAQPIRCNFLQFHARGMLSKISGTSNGCREKVRADEVSIMGFDDEFTLAMAKAAIVIVSSFGALVFLTWIAGKSSFLK
jgi:hypothetical protein